MLEYVPLENLVPNSQRHVLGPVTLEKLAAEIPPSVAAFRLGAEAQYAHYQSAAGDLRMLLFSYPTPQIARAQLEEFEKLPGVISKRAGPLVAAVVAPPSADEAERLLAKVRYRAEITLHHRNLTRSETLWTLLTDIIILSLILAALMIVGGVLVASTRVLATRYAPQSIVRHPGGFRHRQARHRWPAVARSSPGCEKPPRPARRTRLCEVPPFAVHRISGSIRRQR